jgi:hypothetical protein
MTVARICGPRIRAEVAYLSTPTVLHTMEVAAVACPIWEIQQNGVARGLGAGSMGGRACSWS